jgi:hypothetical protein
MAEGYFSLVNGAYVPIHMGSPLDDSAAAYPSVPSWPDAADASSSFVEVGTYFPVAEWSSSVIDGDPIRALAYDYAYVALYAATDTILSSSSALSHPLPYGHSDLALPVVVVPFGSMAVLRPNYQMGITALQPWLKTGKMLVWVSPARVRTHALCGLQLADLPLEGMPAASGHPHSPQTQLTVGGIAVSLDQQQLHSLNLWQGLRIFSSHTLGHNVPDGIAVTALAKIKSHASCVVALAVLEGGTMVATTGYGSKTAPRHPMTPPYGFPDPVVLVHDICYLGRGGFPHSFHNLHPPCRPPRNKCC